jgi:hypothetical protein
MRSRGIVAGIARHQGSRRTLRDQQQRARGSAVYVNGRRGHPTAVATTAQTRWLDIAWPAFIAAAQNASRRPRSQAAGPLGTRGDDAKKKRPHRCGSRHVWPIKNPTVRAQEMRTNTVLGRTGQFVVGRTKPSVVDAFLLTIRPISIAEPVRKRHGRTK